MTTDRLAAVLAALDAATEAEARMTPGEWAVGTSGYSLQEIDGTSLIDEDRELYDRHDAAGIALARNQWPALLRLARACAENVAARRAEADERNAHPDNLASPESRARSPRAFRALDAALLALAPEAQP